MKQISEIQREYIVDKTPEWKLVAKELTEFYGEKCYWVCRKFPLDKVKRVYQQMKKEGDNKFSHLQQKLRYD